MTLPRISLNMARFPLTSSLAILATHQLMTTAGLTLKVSSLMTRKVVQFLFTPAMTLTLISMNQGSVTLPVTAPCLKNGIMNSGLLNRPRQHPKLTAMLSHPLMAKARRLNSSMLHAHGSAADDARAALAAALQSPTNSTAHVDDTVVYNEATNSIELPDQQNEPAVETPTNTTQSGPTNSTAYVDDTVVHDETTSNIELHHPERALVDFRLINMAVAPPCAPWSSLSESRHYESILLSYRQTNCAHRLGVVMACVYNKWLTRWAPCKLRFLHAMMRHVSNFIMRWTAINILRLWNVCALSHRQEVNHESGLALTHGTIYRQRYWSINSLHRVLQSDAAPTLRDVCVWFVRRWALRADVYFDRYLALHANDCTVSTADGDAIMTTLCNWLFHNSMRFYLSHPASMGWFVGRQIASSSNHYQHFLNSILRRLTTTAATCIRTVFHCRPAHSYTQLVLPPR